MNAIRGMGIQNGGFALDRTNNHLEGPKVRFFAGVASMTVNIITKKLCKLQSKSEAQSNSQASQMR